MAIGASVRDPHARRGALGVSLGAVYASSAVHPDGTPAPEVDDPTHDYVPSGRPGGRAPHMDLPDGTSLLDRFGRGWVVLVDAAGGGAMPDGGAGELEVCAMEDPAWRARYGVEGSGAVLVRPDGFIAFRARRCADPVGAARGAMAAILGAGGDG